MSPLIYRTGHLSGLLQRPGARTVGGRPTEAGGPGTCGHHCPPSAPVGLRSRAPTAVGTVEGYVNFCGACATRWASTGP
ncbi:hypothetical protein F750_5107 [Streptomyces sp. PAMC 26508]|nr:hypothetical protein F750_5107 [Streptomyces sp. PAMC 26508]